MGGRRGVAQRSGTDASFLSSAAQRAQTISQQQPTVPSLTRTPCQPARPWLDPDRHLAFPSLSFLWGWVHRALHCGGRGEAHDGAGQPASQPRPCLLIPPPPTLERPLGYFWALQVLVSADAGQGRLTVPYRHLHTVRAAPARRVWFRSSTHTE